MEDQQQINNALFGGLMTDNNNIDMGKSIGFFLEDPITLEIMEEPVMGPCGHSFSKGSLDQWADKKDGQPVTCPTCLMEFQEEELKPNFVLREVVQAYKSRKENEGKKGEEESQRLLEEHKKMTEEHQKMVEEHRQMAEEQRRLADEKRRKEAELMDRLRAEEQRKRELAEENVRLAELERRYVQQLEDLNRRQEAMRREMQLKEEEEEQQRKEKELREKGEIDQMEAKAIADRRRFEDLDRKYKDLQTRYQLQTKQMEDLKGRYRGMENELMEIKGKYRALMTEVKKKEEEEKKNSSSSLLSYIPFSPPAVPSFSISSWVWGSGSIQPGPLVRKFSGYRLDSRRGSHRNSPVWKAIKIEGAEVVAVKKLTLRGEDVLVFREAMLHHHLGHPNVLPLQGIMQGSNKEEYFMILPFVEYDLDHVMNATRFNGAQIRHLMYQLILVVCYLHSAGVVHRDIQPSSVLVSNSGNGRIWLGSLGSARSLVSRPFDPISSSSYLGYRAPEVILSAGPLQKQLTDNDWRAADIWSCGCIFAQLMTRTPLFVGTGSDQVLRSMLSFIDCRESIGEMGVNRFTSLNTHPAISDEPRTSFLETIKTRSGKGSDTPHKGKGKEKEKERDADQEDELLEQAHNLLQQMLTFDPERRISALEALGHPYFEGYRNLMQKKRTLWKCPVERAVLFEDNHVASFLEQQCAALLL